jgi:hypothetical protein
MKIATWIKKIKEQIDNWFDEEQSILIGHFHIETNNYTILLATFLLLLILQAIFYF